MSKYLLAVHMSDEQPRQSMTDEEMRRGFALVETIERDMRAAHALVFSGRLLGPAQARVVRPSRGRVKATDGPYAETKEHLGGFYIIEATDLDAAPRGPYTPIHFHHPFRSANHNADDGSRLVEQRTPRAARIRRRLCLDCRRTPWDAVVVLPLIVGMDLGDNAVSKGPQIRHRVAYGEYLLADLGH